MLNYAYFGNTTLRVEKLLFNFETQLLIFDDLFKNASNSDTWSNDSDLQLEYLKALQLNNLIKNSTKKTDLGSKDARAKSAPLEDFGLINRKAKEITKNGYELLGLIKQNAYKATNKLLQIDLISLFFLKASLNFYKNYKDLFLGYLEVFKAFGGKLEYEKFSLLPLICNFKNITDFIEFIKNPDFNIFIDENKKIEFKNDLLKNTLKYDYFKTAKGEESAKNILLALSKILEFKKSNNEEHLRDLLKIKAFKKPYLDFMLKGIFKEKEKIEKLKEFSSGSLDEFSSKFFEMIFTARIKSNLDDYADLNMRYLNLSGVFEKKANEISINEIFKLLLSTSFYKEILEKIKNGYIDENLLSEYFNNDEIQKKLKNIGISNISDLKSYKKEQDKKKLEFLIENKFSKENIIKILALFNDRKNDDEITKLVSKDATIPTIFEYIIAIAWHYIDNCDINRVLEANLSLDSNLLPKSHAVGGNADFCYSYSDHELMIEVTLTEASNQRRAEMESVSRHLGSLLLNINNNKRASKTFAIFIAPYLDKNVLNDFRSRIYYYYENKEKFIKGMNILPLNCNDLIEILKSNKNYINFCENLRNVFDKNLSDFGSQWYKYEVQKFIKELKNV